MPVRKIPTSKKMALCGMTTALAVLCLYAASLLPVGRIPLLFLAALVSCTLTGEKAYISAIISFIASSLLGFLIISEKQALYAYILLLGHYGIFRSFLNGIIKSRVIIFAIKILYCNLFLFVAVFLSFLLFDGIPIVLPSWLPPWAAIIALQLTICGFDVIYGLSLKIYQRLLRRSIIS